MAVDRVAEDFALPSEESSSEARKFFSAAERRLKAKAGRLEQVALSEAPVVAAEVSQ